MAETQSQTARAVFAVIILIVGFAIAGLLFTFVSVLGGQTYELVQEDIASIQTWDDANHTFVSDNTTWVDLGPNPIRSLTVLNVTDWNDNTSNFDINTTTGFVLLRTGTDNTTKDPLNGTTMQAVYEFDNGNIRNAIENGIGSNFEAQEQIGNYLPIIALAIIITIIIGLIIGGIASKFMGPGGMGRMGGSGGYGGYI